jgi:hypothetical protein
MLKIDFTNETVFSFSPPSLCFLGPKKHFELLAKAIVDLTGIEGLEIEITTLNFVKIVGENRKVIFKREKGANKLCFLDGDGNLRFTLDKVCWDRIFRYFILMSWDKRTYYLNSNEDCLNDIELEQECNFICSSEFE